MAFENPEACPADTSIQVFHMEEGEHILEFESEHDEDFNMAVLKMLGGHAHHDHHGHGHGSGPFEWAGIFEMNDATHTWSMQKVDGDYADPTMRLVLIPTDTPTEETMHGLESGVEALIEGDCTVVEDGETMSSIAAEGSCFELHVGTGDDSTFTIDTDGITGMSMYAQHVPTEFERDQHYLKDSAGTDIEPVAQEGAGAHGDHGDHGDEHGDDHDDHDDEMCHNTETHENYESTEEECEAAGHMWGGDEDHGDEHGDDMCHNTETHENYESTEEDCENAGHVWLGHEDHDLPEIHADLVAHTLSFPEEMVCYDMNTHTVNMSITTESDCQAAGLMWTAANSGPGGDDHSDEEEHHEVGALTIHIEAEGDYGFALPNDVEMYIIMGEGGHDDHDDHGHGSGPFEWAGIFEMNDATHTWSMQKVDGDYADPTMRLVLIPTDTPTEETMHGLESGVEALIEGDCTVVEDGETMSSIAAEGSCFELHVGTGDDSTFTIDTDGITGMSMYAQHVPTEFERDQHYLKDSAGTDIEPVAQEGAGAHGDHGDHGDEHGDDGDEIVAGEGEDAFTYDPHSWLSPIAFEAQLNLVLDSLSSTFPDGSELFTENAASYSSQLMDLHERFTAAFGVDGTCDMAGQDKTIVANHNAYSYMSVQYDIDIITLHGLDPEGEPSPADIAEVVESIEEKGITVLFVEEYTDQTAVNSIVEQTGVSLEILYTMEMAPSDSNDDYLSMMNKNLENIVSGCGC